MANSFVKFTRCTAAQYSALSTKSTDTIYVTTDTGQIYLGTTRLGGINSTSYDNKGTATIDGKTVKTHGTFTAPAQTATGSASVSLSAANLQYIANQLISGGYLTVSNASHVTGVSAPTLSSSYDATNKALTLSVSGGGASGTANTGISAASKTTDPTATISGTASVNVTAKTVTES